ncbi:MAG TPA: Ig-like domain-containing protein, partial [Actinomycetota bacterium]|nr:Ig-like domain-containing protein [Actinomycetota bacterium]
PKAVVSSLVCDNVLDGNTDDPAEVFAERAPSYSSFPGGSRFPGNGECVEAGLRFTPAGLTLTEGGPARTYLARLTLRPAANVTVMPSGGSQASVSPQTLTFTPSNWYAGQIVTVAAVDDALVEGTTIHPVAHTASSSDAAYAGVVSEMPLTIKDNDAGTLVLIESDGSTEVAEGGATDTFTVSLTAPPAAPATISFVPDPQITIVPTAVTFTAQNFATPQTITVTAVDDAVRENDHSGSIEGSSSDPLFGSVPSVLASIKDNDAPAAPAIAFPSEGQILTATDVTVAGTGEPGATVEIFEGMASMGTALVDANGMWSAQIAFGADMTHVITAAQTGTDGLTGGASAARSFSIDMTAPAAPTITGPADGSSFASGNVTVTGTAEPNATVSVYGNGGLKATTTASGSGAWSVETGFVAGSHAITATARDGAGHESGPSLPVNITVALLTPTIVDPAQGSYAKSPVTVRGTADGSHAFVYLYDFGVLKAVVPVTSGVPGTWQTQVAFDSGVRRLTAISRSAANTISPVSAVRTFTADNTAPTAVVHRPQFYTVFGIVTDGTIRGTAREGEVWDSGVARVDLIYLDASGAQVAAAQATCANCPGSFVSWSHKPDLLPGFYTVQARATDRVGNVSAAGTMAFLLVR